jgi:predicted transcriptional regulator
MAEQNLRVLLLKSGKDLPSVLKEQCEKGAISKETYEKLKEITGSKR